MRARASAQVASIVEAFLEALRDEAGQVIAEADGLVVAALACVSRTAAFRTAACATALVLGRLVLRRLAAGVVLLGSAAAAAFLLGCVIGLGCVVFSGARAA